MVLPDRPRLRNLEVTAVTDDAGRRILAITDPLAMTDSHTIGVPIEIAPYLGAADGTRSLQEITSFSILRGAPAIPSQNLIEIFEALDSRYLLENGRFKGEISRRLNEYRSKPRREPAHVWQVYPGNDSQLRQLLDGFYSTVSNDQEIDGPPIETSNQSHLKAIVTPHIDYARGGHSYASIWRRVEPHLKDIEAVVIFGTDHNADKPGLTLTNQSYSSPFGTVSNEPEIVDDLAEALRSGDEGFDPFGDEYHHAREHSIELGLVWLQHAFDRLPERSRSLTVIPILCSGLASISPSHDDREDRAELRPDANVGLARATGVLRELARRKRTLFVAAADLAHVGPVFGDDFSADEAVRFQVAARDRELMEHVAAGNRNDFVDAIARHNDADRICGSSPIYMMLWCTEGATTGEWLAYQQCAADEPGASFVSIAGALLFGNI